MGNMNRIISELQDAVNLTNSVISNKELIALIRDLSSEIVAALLPGKKIIFAGNGGSFADAQHLAAEFAGRFILERGPLRGICLGTNNSLVTAIGNDYDFETIFSRELDAVGCEGDIFIPISSSGNSRNLIKAAGIAKQKNISVFCLLGRDGGELGKKYPSIIIPSNHTARIQEMHIKIGHIICGLVDFELFGK